MNFRLKLALFTWYWATKFGNLCTCTNIKILWNKFGLWLQVGLTLDTTPPFSIVIRSVAEFRGLCNPWLVIVTQFCQLNLSVGTWVALSWSWRQFVPRLYYSLAVEIFSDVLSWSLSKLLSTDIILLKIFWCMQPSETLSLGWSCQSGWWCSIFG